MTTFREFQKAVKKIGGPFSSDFVYFSQMRDQYSAAYKPKYPAASNRDIVINAIDQTGAYLRGNFELVHIHGGKVHAHYYKSLAEVRAEIEEATRE